METAGSSNALDVSTPTQDLKFMQASNINVSNFVSVKLSRRSNYKIWKAQMLCLIESQLLLHLIDAENHFPVDKGVHMIGQYDKLVKGWIFGSVNEKVLNDLVDLDTAQVVWMKLESLFNPPVGDTEGTSSNALDVSAPDAIAPVVYAMREELKYLQALNVDVSNFVSGKLEGERNYYTWKNEMLYLIGSHELLHIINAEKVRFPWTKDDPMTQKYDRLVRGWILNTMNDNRRDQYRIYRSVQMMWRNLESTFTYQPETSNSINTEAYSRPEPLVSASTQDLKYTQALNATVSNFVSVKLSGRNNYDIWKAQVLCLVQSHNLLHIIDSEYAYTPDKYEHLVKGWIFSTMNEQLLSDLTSLYDLVDSEKSAKDVWKTLKSVFDAPKSNGYRNRRDPRELTFGIEFIKDDTEFVSDHPESNIADKKRLYKAAVEGLWRKAKSIFKINKKSATEAVNVDIERKGSKTEYEKKELYEAAAEGRWRKAKSILENGEIEATESITANGNTILHVAVEKGHNYFVEKLLEFLTDEQVPKANNKGRTALHIAAMVGNTNAAQLLVQKT